MGSPLSPRLPNEGTSLAQHGAAEFDAMVRAHYGRLCSFVYRLVNSRTEAEDVVQALFARIWVRESDFDYLDPLPYLYRAARNAALTHIRDERLHARRLGMLEPPAVESRPTAASGAEQADLARAIDRAVAALPSRCRQIFSMSREQSLTYGEIARTLGISVKTVETQMGRALRSLRTALAPYLPLGLMVLATRAYERLIG
jgi:RNA polymerase sigma-70 factor (ECF subfamily)